MSDNILQLIKPSSFIQLNDIEYRSITQNNARRNREVYIYDKSFPDLDCDNGNGNRIVKYWSKGTTILIDKLTNYFVDFTYMNKDYDIPLRHTKVETKRMSVHHFLHMYADKIKTIDFKEI